MMDKDHDVCWISLLLRMDECDDGWRIKFMKEEGWWIMDKLYDV